MLVKNNNFEKLYNFARAKIYSFLLIIKANTRTKVKKATSALFIFLFKYIKTLEYKK